MSTALESPVTEPRATVQGPAARRTAGAMGGAPVAGEAAAKAPPAMLPGEHFAAGVVFLLAGAVGMAGLAPDLAHGAYLSPRVAALTHLFTLGWITTSIMGALYQFLPVALGEPIRSVRAAHVTFALFVSGLGTFVSGLALVKPVVLLSGAAVMSAGVLLFITNLSLTLKRAVRRDVTWWALALATSFLLITLVLGLALTGNLRWGYLGAGRVSSIGVHLHVALAGWVLLVMIGVARRLLPMFLLSHGATDRFAQVAVTLVASGAGVLALLHHAPRVVSHWLPALLIAGGLLSFLAQARAYFVRRHRRELDTGMRLAAGALALLGVAFVLAWPVLSGLGGVRLATSYVSAILLAITLFVVAHYYRIVPFLVWYHRFGPLAGRRAVPRVNELYSGRAAAVAAVLIAMGAGVLVPGIALGSALIARLAAIAFACGAVVFAVQMLLLWRKRP